MSEEFDKEAEREKLREKFEKDAEKRSATQRMSELLLGGATMTDQHCERCGDPLFRDGGETFCPTCASEAGPETAQQPAEAGEAESEAATGTPAQQSVQQSTHGPPQQSAQQSANQSPQRSSQQSPGRTATTEHDGTAESLSQLPENAEVVANVDDAEPDRRPVQQPGDSQSNQPRREQSRSRPAESGDAPDPSAELRRAVAETARKANAATNPRTAREWLEASKEAAEALAALER